MIINIKEYILLRNFIEYNKYQHIHIVSNNNYISFYLKNLLTYKEA